MLDETQLFVKGFGRGRKRQRVLAAVGQVAWQGPEDLAVTDVDIIRAPTVLKQYTSACCAQVCAHADDPTGILPRSGGDLAINAKYIASILAADKHSVNVLLNKWGCCKQRAVGPNRFFVCLYCVQHRTGNIVEQVTKYLGLITPCFCISSMLARGDLSQDLEEYLRPVVDKMLDIVDPTTETPAAGQEDQQRHAEFAKELLNLCYVCVMAEDDDGGDLQRSEERNKAHAQRQREADEVFAFFRPPWGKRLVHPCPAGCCGLAPAANREKTLDRCVELISRVVLPAVSTPAMNKYTKVEPVVTKVTLMASFGTVLRKVILHKLGRVDDRADGHASDVSEDALLGIPTDPTAHMRKLGNQQLHRALAFLSTPSSRTSTLCWLIVCRIIMVIHYRLFKRGGFHSHAREQTRFAVYDFCSGVERSPSALALTDLAAILMDPMGEGRKHVRVLLLKFGAMDTWPLIVTTRLHVASVLAFCGIWRKLVFAFERYPWLLVPAFDKSRSMAERYRTLREFLAAGECCLDSGLSQILRALHPDVEDYFFTDLEDFLCALFQRVVVTSTPVERVFSDFSHWIQAADQGLAQMAAKHVIHSFSSQVNRWRESRLLDSHDVASAAPRESLRSRPVWAMTGNTIPGSQKTGLHAYTSKRAQDAGQSTESFGPLFTNQCRAEWMHLSRAQKQPFIQQAASDRAIAKAVPTRLDEFINDKNEYVEGPLGLSSRHGPFPLRPSAVAERLRERRDAEPCGSAFRRVADVWRREHCNKVLPDEAFPATVDEPPVCQGGCMEGVVDSPEFTHLREFFWKLLKYHTPTALDPTVLLQLLSGDVVFYALVGHSQSLHTKMFEAEFMTMVRVGDDPTNIELPMLLRFQSGRQVRGVHWPMIRDERHFIHTLTRHSPNWDVYKLTNAVASLSERVVTAREHVTYAQMCSTHELYLERQAALKAFRELSGAQAPRRGRGPGGRRGPALAPKGPKGADTTSESESPTESEYINEEALRDIVKQIKKKGSDSGGGGGVPAAGGLGTEGKAAAGAAVDRVGPRDRVVEVCGGASIAEIYRKGVFSGYGITCGRHKNLTDTASTVCKRALNVGAMSNGEVRRRLKRWYVGGFTMEHTWDADTQRTQHLKFGGKQLHELADDSPGWADITEDDLNEMAERG
jgi:hypothetical protein